VTIKVDTAGKKKSYWKKYHRWIIGVVTGIIGLLIVTMIFFKAVPGYNFYVVRSGSMSPAFEAGDLVFTGPAGNILTGKIITFEIGGETVTHRVFAVNGDQITTKGDANKAADTTPITASSVKGSYLFKIPGLGNITSLVSSKKGWFLLVIVPCIILVLFLVKDILKEAFKDEKKKTAGGTSAKVIAVAPVAPSEQEKPRTEAVTAAAAEKPAARQSFISFLFLGDRSHKQQIPRSEATRVKEALNGSVESPKEASLGDNVKKNS
jgi:signal peptidase I